MIFVIATCRVVQLFFFSHFRSLLCIVTLQYDAIRSVRLASLLHRPSLFIWKLPVGSGVTLCCADNLRTFRRLWTWRQHPQSNPALTAEPFGVGIVDAQVWSKHILYGYFFPKGQTVVLTCQEHQHRVNTQAQTMFGCFVVAVCTGLHPPSQHNTQLSASLCSPSFKILEALLIHLPTFPTASSANVKLTAELRVSANAGDETQRARVALRAFTQEATLRLELSLRLTAGPGCPKRDIWACKYHIRRCQVFIDLKNGRNSPVWQMSRRVSLKKGNLKHVAKWNLWCCASLTNGRSYYCIIIYIKQAWMALHIKRPIT